MSVDKFIQDGQDAKVVERIHTKIVDMLTAGEYIQYISLQKKPAVTLLPDSITISNKRIFLCEFTKLGLATNFEIFSWNDIKDIAFKEEIFGSKVTVIPFTGENLTIDYIPKVQARKLYQLIKTALENPSGNKSEESTPVVLEQKPTEHFTLPVQPVVDEPATPSITEENKDEEIVIKQSHISAVEDDELTQKLKKLKTLYDRQLITQSEYENKKTELLSQL
ncbi:PH domain-containing protein [Sphingobacterium chuzhouense]|uniref:PH domain-containing protein n=1 Tax=Sphingobacterium chuzhouense TaxID=1742264 RepID=A0ABR7XLL1_9SPHI|nr:PH domain-containing protein [Sphingobacterium chuzhouense]MBD1420053.1 PH domain-containing protein [Sphingobacterium chuzhouense]